MSTIAPPPDDALPPWLDREVWDAFCEMRRRKGARAPFTARAQRMILDRLAQFRAQGMSPNDCLRESVMNGWSGVFPPKGPAATQKTASDLPWYTTRRGVEAMGESLGLGRWDQYAFEHGHGEHFHVYEARVRRAFEQGGKE